MAQAHAAIPFEHWQLAIHRCLTMAAEPPKRFEFTVRSFKIAYYSTSRAPSRFGEHNRLLIIYHCVDMSLCKFHLEQLHTTCPLI